MDEKMFIALISMNQELINSFTENFRFFMNKLRDTETTLKTSQAQGFSVENLLFMKQVLL